LQELRNEIRGVNAKIQRIGNPPRLFFMPLQPFLIDGPPERAYYGRLSRACLEPIWQWLARDLLPQETRAYSDEISRRLLTGDKASCTPVVRAFQERVVARADETFASVETDDRARRRLAGQVGIPGGLNSLRQVIEVLRARDALASLASRLPPHVKTLSEEHLVSIKRLLDSTPMPDDVFVHALVLVMDRLILPCQLVRLAVRAAESDFAVRIASTRYGIAVTMVLAEMDRRVEELRSDLRRGIIAGSGILLKQIHDGARLLRSDINFGESSWGKQLASLHTEVSDVVSRELETLPGRVRRLLRPRHHADGGTYGILNSLDIAETEALLGFLTICRLYASELAINEVTLRVHREVQKYLEARTPALIESLRQPGRPDRKLCQSQIEAAARFVGQVFDAGYAALLTRAAEVASHGAKAAVAKG
jgi:hypothetical protein